MGNWRDLAALALLAHLVMSDGKVGGSDALKEILSKNLPIIVIDDNANGILELAVKNLTSLNTEIDNNRNDGDNCIPLNTTTKRDEEILEAEMEEAIESAAMSGQVVLISPFADRMNSSKKGPVIVIETPSKNSQSVVRSTLTDGAIDESSRSSDQEIAQSQNHPRSRRENYADSEKLENLKNLLAVADYESQRIDVKTIEKKLAETSSEVMNSDGGRSASRSPIEETHVPRRRILSKNFQRIPLEADPEVSSTHQLPIATARPELQPVDIERRIAKAERRQLPSFFTESLRDRSHPKAETPTVTSSSLLRKLSHFVRKKTPIVSSSYVDAKATLIPSLSETISTRLKIDPDLVNISESSTKKFNSPRVRHPETSTTSPFNEIMNNQTFLRRGESMHSIPQNAAVSEANRRIDYYSIPEYVASTKPEIQPSTEKQLGLLTRYNLPSLVPRELAKSKSSSIATDYRQTGSSGDSDDAPKQSDAGNNSRITNPRRSTIRIPIRSHHGVRGEIATSRPPSAGHHQDEGVPGGETTVRYDSSAERKEEIFPKNHRPQNADYQRNRNRGTASINPHHDFHKNSAKSKLASASASSTPFHARRSSRLLPIEKADTQVPRVLTSSHQQISTTTSAYDSDEDYGYQINGPSTTVPTEQIADNIEIRFTKSVLNTKNNNDDKQNNDNNNNLEKSVIPGRKNAESVYHERRGNPIADNAISPSRLLESQRRKTLGLNRSGKFSSPKSVETAETNNNDNNNNNRHEKSINHGSFGSDSTRNSRLRKAPRYRDTDNDPKSFGAASVYDASEKNERKVNASPSLRGESIEANFTDYGNRIRTRVVENQRDDDGVVALSSTTSPRRRRLENSASRHEDRRRMGKHAEEAPVESANRVYTARNYDYEDELPAGTRHEEIQESYEKQEEEKKTEDEAENEEGGGGEHEEGHHEHHGKKGDKGYKAWHENSEGAKGYHDKETHDKEYEEKEGKNKKHEEESDYRKEHHHEDSGDKEAEFGEKGEHRKGHSTKGQHVVHKKDEYEKKTEFYDESHEEDGEEKEGGYGEDHESEKGGHEKIGHHDSAHHEDKYGERGEHEKGHHYRENKGHKNGHGHDEDHHHEEKYGKKSGREEGEKWSHMKGDNGKKDS